MMLEFKLNSSVRAQETEVSNKLEMMREDRKDERIDRQAAHQRDMIEQRKSGDSGKGFESSGNDIVTGGVGLGEFGPR